MPNLIQISDQLQGMPDAFLQQEAQSPTGMAPPYLVLAEISRRKSLRQQAPAAPATTVYDDLVPAPMRGIDALNPPQPMQPPQQPMQPPVPQPQPAALGLGSMAGSLPPPMAMAARGPIRMAGGGLVRMADGGGTDGGGTVMDLSQYYKPWYMQAQWPGATPVPTADTPVGRTIAGVTFPAYPRYNPTPYTPPPSTSVKEPELEPILARVRALRGSDNASPLADRIQELQDERGRIRQPTFGGALMEMGLGMMANRSPYPGVSLGMAGLGAIDNYRTQQERADTRSSAIADRMATLRAQDASRTEMQRQNDLDLAGRIQQQQHGSAVVNAQNLASQVKDQRDWDRQNRQDERAAQIGEYAAASQQAGLELGRIPAPKAPFVPMGDAEKAEFEWKLQKQLENNAHLAGIQARLQSGQSGLSAGERSMFQQRAVDQFAQGLFIKSLNQIPQDAPNRIEMARHQSMQVLTGLGFDKLMEQKLGNAISSYIPDKNQAEYLNSIGPEALKKAAPVEEPGFWESFKNKVGLGSAPAAGVAAGVPQVPVSNLHPPLPDQPVQRSVGPRPTQAAAPAAGIPAAADSQHFDLKFMVPQDVTRYAQNKGISRDEAVRQLRAAGYTIPEFQLPSPTFPAPGMGTGAGFGSVMNR
jgi:hypothetical protein